MELASEQTRKHGDRQIAQLTIHSKGMMLRAEERSGDIFTSVDMVMDKMKRQIDRYKSKRRDRFRGAQAREIEPVLEEGEVDAEGLLDEINEDDDDDSTARSSASSVSGFRRWIPKRPSSRWNCSDTTFLSFTMQMAASLTSYIAVVTATMA